VALSFDEVLRMDNATARVLGGIYIALCSALSEEGVRLSNDVLYGFADSPHVRPEDQRIYRAIANCASTPIEELRAEDEPRNKRPHLSVVGAV
jgi:hypothetical protein